MLSLANKLEYINDIEYKSIDALRDEVSKTLYGLISAVSSEIK